jgi:uncharacterized protein YbaR (Trm112 family)
LEAPLVLKKKLYFSVKSKNAIHMSFLSRLFGKKDQVSTIDDQALIEAGVCPNCWGKTEYADEYVTFVKDITKSNISGDKSGQKAFIQQFVETHVTGIHLKREGDLLSCPKCKGKYKYVTSKTN